MKKQFLVGVWRLNFHKQADKQTKTAYDRGCTIEANSHNNPECFRGQIQACVSDSLEEAIKVLRKEVETYIKNADWSGLKPSDFTFEISYSIIEDGLVWTNPSMYIHKEQQI